MTPGILERQRQRSDFGFRITPPELALHRLTNTDMRSHVRTPPFWAEGEQRTIHKFGGFVSYFETNPHAVSLAVQHFARSGCSCHHQCKDSQLSHDHKPQAMTRSSLHGDALNAKKGSIHRTNLHIGYWLRRSFQGSWITLGGGWGGGNWALLNEQDCSKFGHFMRVC